MLNEDQRERDEARRLGALAATSISLDEWIAELLAADVPLPELPKGNRAAQVKAALHHPVRAAILLARAATEPPELDDPEFSRGARAILSVLRKQLALGRWN